jgi:hypothetical protein
MLGQNAALNRSAIGLGQLGRAIEMEREKGNQQ